MQASTFKSSLIGAALLAALGAGYARYGGELVAPVAAVAAVPAAATPSVPRTGVARPDFSGIVDTVGPAVVNIGVSGPQRTATDGNDPMNGQPVRDVAQLRALLVRSGRSVALLIERDNVRIFVPVDIG